ncbi:MAG TPA: shikimate dehydrogenase [bacterium]|nr:shikimate dehydrogenase [bacterium]HPN43295.1 shikimate dehydrogenase [bacterium]
MVKASSKLYAVIGDPIAHSLSPLMQNWMIGQFGLNAVYVAFHIRKPQLEACLQAVRTLEIGGLNVTVPHKEAVLPFVDTKSVDVELLQAANTIKNCNGQLQAHVTDPFGFTESLGDNRDRCNGASVVLFGAGGAARSVCYALSRLKIARLVIGDVVADKARELQSLAINRLNMPDVSLFSPADPNFSDLISDAGIIINTTAVGMHPDTDRAVMSDFSCISKHHFVYDVIYNPQTTRLLQQAKKHGATVQNGLDMLIYQGLESLRIFSGEHLTLSPAQLSELHKIMNRELGIYE